MLGAARTRVGDEIAEGLVSGTVLAGYRFTRYKPAPAGETPAAAR